MIKSSARRTRADAWSTSIEDTQGRAEALSHTFSGITDYLIDNTQYDGVGRLEAVDYGNGLYQGVTYDLAGRTTARTLSDTLEAPPIALADADSVNPGSSVTIDVLANDRDFNGDALTVYNLTQPSNGSVAINGDQTITYTPSGSTGYIDSFTYQAYDGLSPSNIATVTVNVIDPGFVDTDGDGLSDAYETSVGLNPNDATDTVADADGDGVGNYAEYLAGTDPLVNDSGLSSAIISLSPFTYWKFDETSGTSLADSSGNGWNGTYNGSYTINQTSVIDTGVSSAFSGGYVRVANNNQLNMVGDYTIEGLIRITSADYTYIQAKNASNTGTLLTAHGSGKVRFLEDNITYVVSTSVVNDGRWRHVAFVRRGNDMEIWINGELDATTTATQPNMATVNAPLELMGYFLNAGRATHGNIDDWAIHQSALKPAQIKAHFKSLGDKDLDTVPTDFEITYLHDPTDANDASADYDGDGSTLSDEYTLGTDPMVHPNGFGASVSTDTPDAYWPLDDLSSSVADSSGNGYTGSYYDSYTVDQAPAITSGKERCVHCWAYRNIRQYWSSPPG